MSTKVASNETIEIKEAAYTENGEWVRLAVKADLHLVGVGENRQLIAKVTSRNSQNRTISIEESPGLKPKHILAKGSPLILTKTGEEAYWINEDNGDRYPFAEEFERRDFDLL